MKNIIKFLLVISGITAQPLTNNTNINITKTWFQEPQGFTYPMSIHVPDGGTPQGGFSVCILLHGNGGNGQGMLQNFISVLPEHALVAPSGYINSWNISDEQSEAPDVEMIENLINILQTFSNVNPSRIRILGVSNGSALVNRVFIENTNPGVDIFCAIVSQLSEAQYHNGNFHFPSGATGGADYFDGYDMVTIPLNGRKYLSICNENDPVIPYAGGPSVGVNFLHAEYAAYIIAQSQGYNGMQLQNGIQLENSNVFKYAYYGEMVVHLRGNANHGTNPVQMEYVSQFFENAAGDLNMDGELDVLDVVLVVGIILNNEIDYNADMNSDGMVNVVDVILLVNMILAE